MIEMKIWKWYCRRGSCVIHIWDYVGRGKDRVEGEGEGKETEMVPAQLANGGGWRGANRICDRRGTWDVINGLRANHSVVFCNCGFLVSSVLGN